MFFIEALISEKFLFKNTSQNLTLENPIKSMTNNNPAMQKSEIISQAVGNFNGSYIDYFLVALGANKLHKSATMENPKIELSLEGENWNSEINSGIPSTKMGAIDDEDIKISLSKEKLVELMIEEDLESAIKQEFSEGEIQIERIAGETELFSKGYLTLYNKLKE